VPNKIRRQKPVKGGREALPSCVLKSIRREVEERASRYRVSKSFVIAVALAEAFGVRGQESYMENPEKSRGKQAS